MTVTLKAPISEVDLRNYPLPPLPSDYTGDKVTLLLNAAWASLNTKFGVNQPLDSTSNTDLYTFPSRYCNVTPSGDIQITPRYLPIISVTSIKWSQNVSQDGWTSATDYDLLNDIIMVRDIGFTRGDYGMVQLVYTSGYATIPEDLKWACALMAMHSFSSMYFPTQAGTSVLPTYLPNDVKDIVSRYKRVR
jgi:hypothetical protein